MKKRLCQNWKLYVIADPGSAQNRSLKEVVAQAIEGGADVIQLRDKNATDKELVKTAKILLEVTRRRNVPLIINDRPQVAKELGAQGVHLGQEDGPLDAARALLGDEAIIGRSTHSPEQALRAQEEGFDYIGVGPVFATPTKPEYTPVGLELVRFAAKNIKIPFVAIGGIDLSNVGMVREAGATTVAVVRALMASEDPKVTAEQIIDKLKG